MVLKESDATSDDLLNDSISVTISVTPSLSVTFRHYLIVLLNINII